MPYLIDLHAFAHGGRARREVGVVFVAVSRLGKGPRSDAGGLRRGVQHGVQEGRLGLRRLFRVTKESKERETAYRHGNRDRKSSGIGFHGLRKLFG